MSAAIGQPDPSPPLVRRVVYGFLCWVIHQPLLLRALGAVMRRFPSLGNALHLVARRSAVSGVLLRPSGFSNTSHAAKLIAGDFLIGMESGPAYEAEHAVFMGLLGRLDARRDGEVAARDFACDIGKRGLGKPFDLVEDYLMPVVLEALKPGFGAAADLVVLGGEQAVSDALLERQYMLDVRHVAAHLFGGDTAPVDVQRRAELAAAALSARIKLALPVFLAKHQVDGNFAITAAEIERNLKGLAWVSHPVAVQAGALVVQELLGRPEVYRDLLKRAAGLDDRVWDDIAFRDLVKRHLLELMRFRPVFPMLARAVPRPTTCDTGTPAAAVCPAGSTVGVLTLSALFDSQATPAAARYCPHRNWGDQADARMLMFGLGPRQCPGMGVAVEILTSVLIGFLTWPELTWADSGRQRIGYDGPMVSRLRLRAARR